MAILKFTSTWDKEVQKKHAGVFALKPKPEYAVKLWEGLKKLAQIQEKKQEDIDLVVTVEWHARKRTLDQNNLMWALYEVEANEINGPKHTHRYGNRNLLVTPEDLYEQDLANHEHKVTLQVSQGAEEILRRHFKKVVVKASNPLVLVADCYYGSSQFDTRQMSQWIEMIFDRLSERGVHLQAADIQYYWQSFKQWQNDEHVIRFAGVSMTQDEYKAKTLNCEACGRYVAEGGSLAHIQAKGMGGHPAEWKGKPENWLHLCDPDHALFDNGKGREFFLKKYPHLTYKVEQAESLGAE